MKTDEISLRFILFALQMLANSHGGVPLLIQQLSKGVLTLEESGVGKSELDEDGVDDNKGEGVYELVDNKGDGVDDFLLSL